jgi:ATP-binding cassette subfamily C protein/ATP-binding cassette subfamily C protein CydC
MNTLRPLQKILHQLPLTAFLPTLLVSLLSSLSAIALMGAAAWIIASAALHPPLYTLALGITLVRACGISRAVFRYLERWISHRAVFSQLTRLRCLLYQQASRCLPERRPGKASGEFLHDLTVSIDCLRDFYLKVLLPPLTSLLLTLLGCLLLWPLSAAAALTAAAAWLLLCLLSLGSALHARRQGVPAQQRYRSLLLDTLHGLADLQGNLAVPQAADRLSTAASTLTAARRREQYQANCMDTAAPLISGIAWTVIFFLLAPLTQTGQLSGIELAVYLLALQSIFAEYQPLPAALRGLQPAAAAASRLLTAPPEVPMPAIPDEAAPAALLCARHITFSYAGQLPVFEDLSFTIGDGEKIAILGESGSGKTTLFHLLSRLWEPSAGQFFLQGTSYTSLTRPAVRRHFAPASQAGYIFSDSLRANFQRLHPALTEDAIWTALLQAGLADEVHTLPQELDTPLGENGARLSGGQRQRLLLALAFASTAPILLLDEPFAGLDRAAAEKIMYTLQHDFANRTILMITHDLIQPAWPDRVLRLENGQLQELQIKTPSGT